MAEIEDSMSEISFDNMSNPTASVGLESKQRSLDAGQRISTVFASKTPISKISTDLQSRIDAVGRNSARTPSAASVTSTMMDIYHIPDVGMLQPVDKIAAYLQYLDLCQTRLASMDDPESIQHIISLMSSVQTLIGIVQKSIQQMTTQASIMSDMEKLSVDSCDNASTTSTMVSGDLKREEQRKIGMHISDKFRINRATFGNHHADVEDTLDALFEFLGIMSDIDKPYWPKFAAYMFADDLHEIKTNYLGYIKSQVVCANNDSDEQWILAKNWIVDAFPCPNKQFVRAAKFEEIHNTTFSEATLAHATFVSTLIHV
jgi:hypothetical protein